MAASVWTGSISFGLLSIPIQLYPAARTERINLHQIHKKCHTRLRQPLYCPTCHRIVERSEVVKGFEYEKGHYILIENEELRKITPPSVKAMEESDRVGIAKVTMHQREYTVFIRPRSHGLTVHTMYYVNEIRKVEGYGKITQEIKLRPQEIKLAEQLVESLSEDFKPQQYHDTYQENLKALIEAKRHGKTIVEEEAPKQAPVIDMMEALKRSLHE